MTSPLSSASPQETGFQFLARLAARPNLHNLWTESLFPAGLDPGEVVEISGDEGSGKTETLLNLTAKCIQPKVWTNVDIEGLEVGVLYIDSNFQLDLKRLSSLLDLHLRRRTTQSATPDSKPNTEHYLKSCFSRLHVVRPSSSDSLFLSLVSLKDEFFMSRPDVGVLVLDSLNSFHWIDRPEEIERNLKPYESPHHKRIASILLKLVDTFKINIFVTLSNVFRKTNKQVLSNLVDENLSLNQDPNQPTPGSEYPHRDEFFSCRDWQRLRTYKLKLEKQIVYEEKKRTDILQQEQQQQQQQQQRQRLRLNPCQKVSYKLFRCSSKSLENHVVLTIKSGGISGL